MPITIEGKHGAHTHVVDNERTPIIGIDLGTTNSLVAYVKDGVPSVLTTREGKRLIPSVVTVIDGKPTVGYAAKHEKVRHAEKTVFSVKRLLGRGFQDLEEARRTLPYKIIESEGGQSQGMPRIQLGDRAYTPIEISAMILREARSAAEATLGQKVTKAVITVPAYFNDSQRQATRMAGRLAGLDVLRIINEPTAASLAYGLDRKKDGLIAVYDLGGGTFDISILKLHDGIFEVLATNGNTALGGDDLDQLLVQVAAKEIQAQHRINVQSDIQLNAALIEASEAAKILLSTQNEAQVRVALPNGIHYTRQWTRKEFEDLARPVLEKTRQPCLDALKDAGLTSSELSAVVMVGGPTRLSVVQDVARQIFGREPNTSVHPDEVVALGAAIQADILAGNNRELLLLDVVPLSLGIETYGGLMSPLITRNSRIPTVAREGFTTFVDNQTGVDIHVLQGERDRAVDNRSLARFKLKGLKPSPAGTPRIEVSFLIDADGILQVAARDQQSGNEQAIEVRPSYGLTDTEVEKMLLASLENAEQDVSTRKLVEARNDAQPILRNTEKKLADARRLLPEEEALALEARFQALRSAVEGTHSELIRQASHDLNESTKKLAELLIQEAIQLASAGKSQ